MRHTVFLNDHFYNYTHIYKVTFINKKNKEELVPLIDNFGMPTNYNISQNWSYFTFGIAYSILEFHTNKSKFENGLMLYIMYYLKERKIIENKSIFKLYIKDIDQPKKWEKNFLRKQIQKPWQDAGICEIENGQANYFWNKKMDSVFNNIR